MEGVYLTSRWDPIIPTLDCSTVPGHSPSWMRTLMRRTDPPLALARKSLSSGVTTSARNMAGQQSLPPAKHCSRRGGGLCVERQKTKQTGRELQIFSPARRQWSPTRGTCWPTPSFTWDDLTWCSSDCWRRGSLRECDGVFRGITQVTGTVSREHRQGTRSPRSQI